MAERKKRFSGLYWQQFALTAGMVMLTLLLLGVSFFALSYNYNFTERRDELQERASLIAQVSVDYLKSGGQTEDENLKRFISLGSAMTNAEFLVCNDSGYALLTADQRLGGKVVAIPQEITQEVLTGSGLYQGRSSLGGAYTSKQFVVVLWNRVFCHSDHRLRSLPAGRICRSRKTSVGGSSLCRRRNGRRNDGTRQIKADKTEHFFKKQTFKFEKPML